MVKADVSRSQRACNGVRLMLQRKEREAVEDRKFVRIRNRRASSLFVSGAKAHMEASFVIFLLRLGRAVIKEGGHM